MITEISTAKAFQDRQLHSYTHHIKVKVYGDFEVRVSCTLSSSDPGPVVTFCSIVLSGACPLFSINKNEPAAFYVINWQFYITTCIYYFTQMRILLPEPLFFVALIDFPWSTPENWNPWSFLHVCKNSPSGRSSKCLTYCTHRYIRTRSNGRIFTTVYSLEELDSA